MWPKINKNLGRNADEKNIKIKYGVCTVQYIPYRPCPNREKRNFYPIRTSKKSPSFIKRKKDIKIHLLQYRHTILSDITIQSTHMARDRQDEIAMDTIDLLEARLERIILLLSGMEPPEGERELRKYVVAGEGEGIKRRNNLKEENVRARLARLEKGLEKVVGGNRVFGELMGICMKLFSLLYKKKQHTYTFRVSWEEKELTEWVVKADGSVMEFRYCIS